jgi:hypothetical protein
MHSAGPVPSAAHLAAAYSCAHLISRLSAVTHKRGYPSIVLGRACTYFRTGFNWLLALLRALCRTKCVGHGPARSFFSSSVRAASRLGASERMRIRLIGALAWAAVFAPVVAPRTQVLVAEFRFLFAGVLILRVATCLRSRTCRVWSGRVCGAVCPGDVEGRARVGRWPRDVSPRPLPLHALVRMVAGLSPLCVGRVSCRRAVDAYCPRSLPAWRLYGRLRGRRSPEPCACTAGGRGWDESHLRSSPGYVTAVGGDLRAAGQHLRG